MKNSKNNDFYRCISPLLVLILSGLIILPRTFAASAQIEVSGNEGPITVIGTAGIAVCKICSGSGENEVCTLITTGSLQVTRNSTNLCSATGSGELTCSNVLNGGLLHQGNHTFIATADDCVSTATDVKTITIDNTPSPTIMAGPPDGAMNPGGTVGFKENTTGNEGTLSLYIDWNNDGAYNPYGNKSCEGTSLPWTWKSITGSVLNSGTMIQGTHRIVARATSANGTTNEAAHVFTVDNTPESSISAGEPNGDMNVSGTAGFKGNALGNEGSITLYIDWNNDGAYSYRGKKNCEGTSLPWTWKGVTGSVLNSGTMIQGTHKIIAMATSANYTTKETAHVFTVDNTPESSISAGEPNGDMNVSGNAGFKGNALGNEGSITLYIDWNNDGAYSYRGKKNCEGTSLPWTWKGITGSVLNSGTMAQGTHKIIAMATAANYTTKEAVHVFTVDNTPESSISAGEPNGDMNVSGTAGFKGNALGNEGSITLYIDWNNDGIYNYRGRKNCEGTSLPWTWKSITGSVLNSGTMAQGTHKIIARATAANYTIKDATHLFTVDNTPTTTIIGTMCQENDAVDILGTTQFKGNVTGVEGSIALYTKEINASSYTKRGNTISYEGENITWKYSDFTGTLIPKSEWGEKELMVKVTAIAINGASASTEKSLVIPAQGSCSPSL